jgi:hypothetical protein
VRERSAVATIKGYFYQFDQTIVSLLEASPHGSVTVEGVEDIDLDDPGESAFVQCKYYEGTEYNHSVIKDAVVHMLRHFHAAGCPSAQVFRYRLHGHYQRGQHKLALPLTDDFVKEHFLTSTKEGKVRKVHEELALTDEQLADFLALLDVNVNAPSYDAQKEKMSKLLVREVDGCTSEDAQIFFYPMAINVVQGLALEADVAQRKITKAQFLNAINRKDVVFNVWLRDYMGREYFARMVRRKYFSHGRTKLPKASRLFVIEMGAEFDVAKASRMLAGLGRKFSHTEHLRTHATDRFCPYVLLRGLAPEQLVELKENLWRQGVAFLDGYPFHGAAFSPTMLAEDPTKERLWKLKFVPDEHQLAPTIAACARSLIEVFDFYQDSPFDPALVPKGTGIHSIKSDSAYLLQEVMQA